MYACASFASESRVYRCTMDGVPTYSDRPCAALGATEVLPALTVDADGATAAAAPVQPLLTGATCAAPSLAELPAAVGRAFATRDSNALASLYHWPGLDGADARRMYGRFNALLAQPLQHVGFTAQPVGQPASTSTQDPGGSRLDTASIALAASTEATSTLSQPDPGATGAALWLQVGPPQAPRSVRFDVVENAGCVWLQFS